jgi:hypothetical protein
MSSEDAGEPKAPDASRQQDEEALSKKEPPSEMQFFEAPDAEEIDEDSEPKGKMTVSEAGRKGGKRTSETRGREFYQEIGHKGGEKVKAKYGSEFYSRIGKKGGEAGQGEGQRAASSMSQAPLQPGTQRPTPAEDDDVYENTAEEDTLKTSARPADTAEAMLEEDDEAAPPPARAPRATGRSRAGSSPRKTE